MGNDMKTIIAVLMLLISASVLADKPVCYEGSTFPACVNANHTPHGLAPDSTETDSPEKTVYSIPEPGTLFLMGLGLAATSLVTARKRKL